MRPSSTIITGASLAELAVQINVQHRWAEEAVKGAAAASANALAAAKRVGDLLSQAKRAVGRSSLNRQDR